MSLEVSIKKGFPLSRSMSISTRARRRWVFSARRVAARASPCAASPGIETPDEGRIVVNGRVFFDSEKKVNLTPQQRKTALLFQNYMLFPNLTVAQNVAAGIGRDVAKSEARSIVRAS